MTNYNETEDEYDGDEDKDEDGVYFFRFLTKRCNPQFLKNTFFA